MAHILSIIPKGVRVSKRVQTLSCMKDNTKNIDCASKIKKQLEKDVFEQNNNIMLKNQK